MIEQQYRQAIQGLPTGPGGRYERHELAQDAAAQYQPLVARYREVMDNLEQEAKWILRSLVVGIKERATDLYFYPKGLDVQGPAALYGDEDPAETRRELNKFR